MFIAYSATSLVAICVLAGLSQTKYGDRFVLIDLTLCALAGKSTPPVPSPPFSPAPLSAYARIPSGVGTDLICERACLPSACVDTGSFTVLSTKAISSFLNLMFLDT